MLQLSERWSCHICLLDRVKFASLGDNLVGGRGLFVKSNSLSLSGRRPDRTEIFLTVNLGYSLPFAIQVGFLPASRRTFVAGVPSWYD